jgi:hypothetical protein
MICVIRLFWAILVMYGHLIYAGVRTIFGKSQVPAAFGALQSWNNLACQQHRGLLMDKLTRDGKRLDIRDLMDKYQEYGDDWWNSRMYDETPETKSEI